MTPIKIPEREVVDLELPDGRIMHVWAITTLDHACVDIWTTRGREVEEISANTGDTTRAPMGHFVWRNGQRFAVQDRADEVTSESHGWPAVSTVTLLWDYDDGGTR